MKLTDYHILRRSAFVAPSEELSLTSRMIFVDASNLGEDRFCFRQVQAVAGYAVCAETNQVHLFE